MFSLNAYFCRELRFVAILRSKLEDFYSEIKELTQILLRISEEKFGGWGLCCSDSKELMSCQISMAYPMVALLRQ